MRHEKHLLLLLPQTIPTTNQRQRKCLQHQIKIAKTTAMKRNSRRYVQKQNQKNERSRSPFFNLAHDESKQHPLFFQTQLKTGEKGDKFEKEADQAAGKVTNKIPSSPEPVVQKHDISTVQISSMKEDEQKSVQKQVEKEEKPVQKAEKKEEERPVQKAEKKEDEKPIQKEEKKEEDKPVQKAEKKEEDKPLQKAESEEKKETQTKHEEDKKDEHPPIMHKKEEGKGTDKSSDISERIKNTKGKGRPLSERTARQMEQAFNANFTNVIIHTDSESDALNKDLHSLAFTNGSDIYFAEGKYNPDSSSGKTLLAHELTHVIQQTGK
jgi:hypothetical protein